MEREATTRASRIDPQLKAAGWDVVPFVPDKPLSDYQRAAVKEYETRNGPADYALCDGGRVLGVVEAKKLTLGGCGRSSPRSCASSTRSPRSSGPRGHVADSAADDAGFGADGK
jgi:hypothetical protein